jgi:cytochrome c-type biogenesis protein CcmH/NrfG
MPGTLAAERVATPRERVAFKRVSTVISARLMSIAVILTSFGALPAFGQVAANNHSAAAPTASSTSEQEFRTRIADLERQLNARELPEGKPGERKGR